MRKPFLLSLLILFSCLSYSSIAEAQNMNLSGIWIEQGSDPLSNYATHYHITSAGDGGYSIEKRGAYQQINHADSYHITVGGTTVQGYLISGTVQFDWRLGFANGSVWTRNVRGLLGSDGNRIRLKFEAIGPNGAVGNVANGWREYEDERILVRYQ